MSFHRSIQMSVQSTYEVRRTGLNRLSIIIDGSDEPVSSPRLVLCGDDAILVRDSVTSVVLPEFPQEYIPELLQGGSVLIGERDNETEEHGRLLFSVSRFPVRRFYEAVVCLSHESPAATNAMHGKTSSAGVTDVL